MEKNKSSNLNELIKTTLQVILTAAVTFGISKLSAIEESVSTLNTQMATIIERTANQDSSIKINKQSIDEVREKIFHINEARGSR